MGLGGQLVQWTLPFVEQLVDRGFRVIRFDNRDVGLSSRIDAPVPTRRQILAAIASKRYAKSAYTLADMADDTAGLLDAIGVEQAHVVGVSMGGMISQSLAIRHPRRVASLTSIMSNTGDRRHGRVHRSLLRKAPRYMTLDPAERVENGMEMFRLISGPHFDAPAVRAMLEESSARSDDLDGAARQTMAILASPDRTWDLRRVAGADAGRARPARSPRHAERWHRDGPGDPRLAPGHVPGHGPRPAGAALGRADRGDRAQHSAGRRRLGGAAGEDRLRIAMDAAGRAPGPGRPRRRGRAAAGDLDRRRRADRHRRNCAGRPVTSRTTTC